MISHEIAHSTLNHSVNSFRYKEKLIDKYFKRKETYTNTIKELSSYSQKSELEADNKGFIYALKAGYNPNDFIGTIKVLEHSQLPFEDIDFDLDFFDDSYYKIPKDKFNSLNIKNSIDTVINQTQYKSHPEYQKRIDEIKLLINKNSSELNSFNKEDLDFKKNRTLVRFETLKLNLYSKNYTRAFYEAYLLSKKYPDNLYLKEVIGKALYGISKSQINVNSYLYSNEKFLNSKYFKLYSFLVSNLNDVEKKILAIKYIDKYKLFKLDLYKKDLFYDLLNIDKINLEEYISKNDLEDSVTLNSLKDSSNLKYYHYAFVNQIGDSSFNTLIKDVLNTKKKGVVYFSVTTKKNRLAYEEHINQGLKQISVGSNLVIVSPYYEYDHKKLKKKILKSDKKERGLVENLNKITKYYDINPIITSNTTNCSDIDEFNRLRLLQECSFELVKSLESNMLPLNYNELDSLMTFYDSKYLYFTGVLSRKETTIVDIYFWIYLPPLMASSPFLMPILIPLKNIFGRMNVHYNILYSINERRVVFDKAYYSNGTYSYFDQFSVLNQIFKEISKKDE